jgi:hypothetical protein
MATLRNVWSVFGGTAGLALAVALAVAAVMTGAENRSVREPVDLPDLADLLHVFQEGKDAAEQVDPPEVGLGPAFERERELPIDLHSM